VKSIQDKKTQVEWLKIAQITEKTRTVNIHFKVLRKDKSRIVTQRASGRKFKVAECVVGDQTGKMKLTLWNEDIDIIEENRTYTLLSGSNTVYDECMFLTKGRYGELSESNVLIEYVNDQIDMSRPFMGKPKRKEKPRSLTGRTFEGTTGREAKGYCARKSF
jgi:replication factor A1